MFRTKSMLLNGEWFSETMTWSLWIIFPSQSFEPLSLFSVRLSRRSICAATRRVNNIFQHKRNTQLTANLLSIFWTQPPIKCPLTEFLLLWSLAVQSRQAPRQKAHHRYPAPTEAPWTHLERLDQAPVRYIDASEWLDQSRCRLLRHLPRVRPPQSSRSRHYRT